MSTVAPVRAAPKSSLIFVNSINNIMNMLYMMEKMVGKDVYLQKGRDDKVRLTLNDSDGYTKVVRALLILK